MATTRLLLTRPLAQAQGWAERLQALDVPTVVLPLIEIVPAGEPAQIRQAWERLRDQRLVMFVSPNAVAGFFAHRPRELALVGWPAQTFAATVGPGSAQALREHGVPVDRIIQPPPRARSLDSEHLWPELQQRLGTDWRHQQALLVRGDGGREWLGDRLREAGAQVAALSVYTRRCPTLDVTTRPLLHQALDDPRHHVWLFSSAEAIGHLDTLVQAETRPTAAPCWRDALALATHERIAARARALGVGHVVLVRPDAAAVAAAFRRLSGSTLESSS